MSLRLLGLQPGIAIPSVAEATRMHSNGPSSASPCSTDNTPAIFPPRWISDEGLVNDEYQIDSLPPQLCAVPKRKASSNHNSARHESLWTSDPHAAASYLIMQLSLHRRGNRRIWYQLKRKPEVALCSFCGMVAARGTLFIGSPNCTGQCLGPSRRQYPDEYKQPI